MARIADPEAASLGQNVRTNSYVVDSTALPLQKNLQFRSLIVMRYT